MRHSTGHKIAELLITCVILAGCGDSNPEPRCSSKRIEHIAENWAGTINYNNELKTHVVRYFVPGTIDSRYTCIVCNGLNEEFQIQDLEVIFSGNLLDDDNEIQPNVQIGGEEFFYLEILNISLRED